MSHQRAHHRKSRIPSECGRSYDIDDDAMPEEDALTLSNFLKALMSFELWLMYIPASFRSTGHAGRESTYARTRLFVFPIGVQSESLQ